MEEGPPTAESRRRRPRSLFRGSIYQDGPAAEAGQRNPETVPDDWVEHLAALAERANAEAAEQERLLMEPVNDAHLFR